MATGVKPRDEDFQFSRVDLDAIQDAMKSKKFRDLLNDYCEEVRDPANQAIYQKEMTQLEKECGYDVTFLNPKGGYVIKTSVAGDRKAFINVCSNDNVGKPSCSVQEVNGERGMNWQLPYSIIPPREDLDQNKQRCVIYDVVFHPDTLRMAEVNNRFRELVNKTALDGLQNTYNIHFDSNNCRYPKLNYKGMTTPAVIRKEDPNFVPPESDKNAEMSPELIEKLYPQKVYTKTENTLSEKIGNESKHHKKKAKTNKKEFVHSSENGYTLPKYVIKQQKNVDLQDYTYHRDSKQFSAIPSQIVVDINLPLLSSTKDCVLDVKDKHLHLISEKPAKYKLEITLPYSVNDECGTAKFDLTKHILTVTLPVKTSAINRNIITQRADSGIDSENNSFDEDETSKTLVEEISSTANDSNHTIAEKNEKNNNEEFLQTSVSFTLPSYTYNVLDDIIAFTFHVKNADPNSVQLKREDNKIYIKFSSLGSGFVPIYYAAIILFDEGVKFNDVTGEAWDNNVILQLELNGVIPENFAIGLSDGSMKKEFFDITQVGKSNDETVLNNEETQEGSKAVVEVTNSGKETNIFVSNTKNKTETKEEEEEREIVWIDSGHCDNGAKGILRKSINIMRSFSESSYGDVASSMDYISSDCIPEESSLKKTVRFSDVIARQVYRYNSSIEGQKRKNQRKKSKKRNQERRRSESEAEEESSHSIQSSKSRLKSVLKQRHDSGLADTSDAEVDCKYAMSDSEVCYGKLKYPSEANRKSDAPENMAELNIEHDNNQKENIWAPSLSKSENKSKHKGKEINTCDNIKHNTDFYEPNKLNKGQYSEVKFKNDLIFELDM